MDKASQGISVIVCCYNSAKRLPETLRHLSKQEGLENKPWEIVLVDNNSTDSTSSLAKQLWLEYDCDVDLIIIEEKKPGLSHARNKGISASSYDLLVFCDDDNWLESNYLIEASKVFLLNENIGAAGGWCDAVFEAEEPVWFTTFQENFAVGKPMEKSGYCINSNSYLYGAGLCIRKKVLNHLLSVNFRNLLDDRKGNKLSSGGDLELVYAIRIIGYSVYFSETMSFKHYMPKSRMTWNYLMQLRKAMISSNFILEVYVDCVSNNRLDLRYIRYRYMTSLRRLFKSCYKYFISDQYKKEFLKNSIVINFLVLIKPFQFFKLKKNILFYSQH